MTVTEKMLKDAFERQAERTLDTSRLLASVRAGTRARTRPRPAWYALITAGVAAAVAAPVVLFGSQVPSNTVAVDPTPTTSVSSGPPVYGPTWLPDRMAEWSRNWYPDGVVARQWRTPQRPGERVSSITLVVSDNRSTPPPQHMETVDVGGRPGLFSHGWVEWQAGDGKWLIVRAEDWADEDVMRIAASVRLGNDALLTRPIEFGWTPPGLELKSTFMKPEGDSWSAAVSATAGGKSGGAQLDAEILPSWPHPGTPVTVRGRQGQYRAVDQNAGEVWTSLDDGRILKVTGWFGAAELVRVADAVTVVPNQRF
ncbi:MAG: hypothetical protein ABW215_20285 [Kibdelosporangium sp.]